MQWKARSQPANHGYSHLSGMEITSEGAVALCEVGQAEAADVPGRSDGEGVFGECDRHAIQDRGLGCEFVVAAPRVLYEGMPGRDDPQRAVSFQAAHGRSRDLSRLWSASIRLFA